MFEKYWNNKKHLFFAFLDSDKAKMERDPEKDWANIVIAFLITPLIILGIYNYIFITSGTFTVPESEQTGSSTVIYFSNISKDNLKKILTPWEQRKATFDNYSAVRPTFDFLK